MSTEHSQALPRSVVLLRLLRRILSVTAVACAAAGILQVPSLLSRVIAVFKYVSNRPKTASPHLISA